MRAQFAPETSWFLFLALNVSPIQTYEHEVLFECLFAKKYRFAVIHRIFRGKCIWTAVAIRV